MFKLVRVYAAFAIVLCTACAPQTVRTASAPAGCADRVAAIMAPNTQAIAAHRFGQASRVAERAARTSLQCGDRWRGANALIVAAELAHQDNETARARTLLHEGFAIMRGLRGGVKMNAITTSLLAQRLGSAQREMHGHWAYW